jgi:(p)ppGpp synthase/HD superfamily hydrolase
MFDRWIAYFVPAHPLPAAHSVQGYSDRINHALAYAAKHHDHQVRKGARAPYLTQPADVAIIQTRYGQEETTVDASILHDVVEDCFRDGQSPETIEERLGEKFGEDILDILASVAQRRTDDDGVEMSAEEQRNDVVERLEAASDRGRWVCLADKLHDAGSLIADLRRTMDPGTVWARTPAGQAGTVRWYRSICARLELLGFTAPILDEMRSVVTQLESFVAR